MYKEGKKLPEEMRLTTPNNIIKFYRNNIFSFYLAYSFFNYAIYLQSTTF